MKRRGIYVLFKWALNVFCDCVLASLAFIEVLIDGFQAELVRFSDFAYSMLGVLGCLNLVSQDSLAIKSFVNRASFVCFITLFFENHEIARRRTVILETRKDWVLRGRAQFIDLEPFSIKAIIVKDAEGVRRVRHHLQRRVDLL